MPAEAFRDRVGHHSPLHALLLRYTHAFLAQVSQSVACNCRHTVEQRCCRWLLMMHSRLGTDHFPLTHEFLAAMLGVRRASVTEVARALRRARLIRYTRGHMTVLNHRGLESAACECFAAVQAEYDRLEH
jgi:CRP-like cAMP-binding protein